MDLSDFVHQIPLQILLAPFFFGGIYIVLMMIIIQRSRKRKRTERERNTAILAGRELPPLAPTRGFWQNLPLGNFLRGELPEKPLETANWTVPAELRNLPEPDLDMLAQPVHSNVTSQGSTAQATATPAKVSPARDGDSVSTASVQVAQAAAPVNRQTLVKADSRSPVENDNNETSRDTVEVLRVYRHLDGGGLIIEMSNKRYSTLEEIQNADLSRRFTGLVNELAVMANELQNSDIDDTEPNSTDGSATSGPSARIGLLKGQQEVPKRDFIHSFARVAMAQTDVQETSAGIADAVEEFLQFKLSNTPQFAERSIHIRSGRDHAISIEVDGHYYNRIGDVVDPDVRDFLLGMMREWEARH